jgi:hypothetical protein
MASAWLQNSKVKPSGESQTYAEASFIIHPQVKEINNPNAISSTTGIIKINFKNNHMNGQ